MTTTNDERDEQQRDQPARFKPGDEVWVKGRVRGINGNYVRIDISGQEVILDVRENTAIERADDHDN